ncbi:MAG TPA: SCO family protein [Rectinemataceae bacterium]|nr:SCO family protein [Rectinemataceae bacterium]
MRGTGRVALAIAAFSIASLRLAAHGAGDVPIGFDEKLGAIADIGTTFTGEDGKPLTLKSLAGRPMILTLAYYRCKDQCNLLLTGLAAGLRDVPGTAGKDYEVVTVSINPIETTADALDKKRIALASIEKPFPPDGWRFLVGTHDNIDRLAASVGFSYRQEGVDFDHPLGVIVLAPDGKIVRYIPGTSFLAIDLQMSLMEASQGLVRPTVAKLLRVCLSYNPVRNRFELDLIRVAGTATILAVGMLAVILVVAGTRRRRRAAENTRN